MQISELSRRSGVPASTLRYYGQIGLLPADRTAAGYRLYDERARQRLMFIEAAKRLQLSLPAIAELLVVWQSDACRAVKDQLRLRLDKRLAETTSAIADLQLLRDQLFGARTRLDALPDRDHRCDPNCAFLLNPHDRVTPLSLADQPSPPRCSLDDQGYRDRIAAWHDLLAEARVTPTANGFVACLAMEHASALTGLIVTEQSCCSFLQFTVTFTGVDVQVSVAGLADAQPVIADLAGLPAQERGPR
ncbi:MerR family transcriptional regulator [Mycobacterium antarcticum]|nr:MerR family transcriptional regulator [Mycolicibacterium sp. TUM20984]